MMKRPRQFFMLALVSMSAAVSARAAAEFDGASSKDKRDLLSEVRSLPGPGASPNLVPLPQPAPDSWQTEVLNGAVNAINRRFQALEAGGFEVRVEKCQFARFSPDTILIRKRKLPEGLRSEIRTESLLGSEFQRRMAQLEAQGTEVEIRCFENIPWLFGDHGVIQYRSKPR